MLELSLSKGTYFRGIHSPSFHQRTEQDQDQIKFLKHCTPFRVPDNGEGPKIDQQEL
jgi:hypothetical protein